MTAGTASLTPEAMSAWWGFEPEGVTRGGHHGLSAALWRFDDDAPFEVEALPDPATHIITPMLTGRADCELFLDGKRRYRRPFETGTFNLVRAGERPRAIEYSASCSFLHIYLPDRLLRSCLQDETESVNQVELVPIEVERDCVVNAIARALRAEMARPMLGTRMVVDGLTLHLVGHLLRHHSNHAGTRAFGREPGRGGLAAWQVQRVCDRLQADLTADIGLTELAALAGLSAEHFCRAFKASTGLPPHAWLVAQRMMRARDLLETTRLSIQAIAAQVGYAEPSHLARMFKRTFGASPTQYRRERRS